MLIIFIISIASFPKARVTMVCEMCEKAES